MSQPADVVRASIAESLPASNEQSEPSEWPALFGANRLSFVDTKINAIWPTTGPKLVWESPVGTGYGSPVTAQGRVVFSHRLDQQEIIECRDVSCGDLLWQVRYPTTAVCDFEYSDGPYSTPVIDAASGRVFHVGGHGQFKCVDFETGRVLWSRALHDEYGMEPDIFPVGASPLLDKNDGSKHGQLIFGLGSIDAGVISLDAATGETRWEATEDGPSYGTPFVSTIESNRYAFVLTAEGLVSLEPDSGRVDWHFPFRRRGDLARNATSPLVLGDRVFLIASGRGAACLKVMPDRSYEKVWHERRSLDSQYNTLMLVDESIYSFTSSGQGGADFCCLDTQTGKIAWRYRSVLKRGMGLASRNAFVLLGERGHLASLAISDSEPQVLSFTTEPLMSDPCYCSPAIAGSLLILKDEERIAVFDLGQ
ncbi:MAG: PQQ-binding-like beta-propeller repeat protein [Planctomycetota bacterium]